MVRPVTDDDIGLKVLREAPAEAHEIIDIVAIHGIGAHPDDTWCKNVGTAESPQWVNWLDKEDMLPAVAPHARIMRYGYQSPWLGVGPIGQKVSTVAQRLLLALRQKREEYPYRPLLFIAHCFGGLVVLKALLDAENKWPGLLVSTIGLVFLGTPFRGAEGMSQKEILEAAQREYQEDEVQPEVLKILEPWNEFAQELVDQFGKTRREVNKVAVACFYELKSSNVGKIVGKEGQTRFVVGETSGCLDLSDSASKFSLSRTHFDMNKFGKPTEEDFEMVREVVKKMVKSSHGNGQNAMIQLESVLENLARKSAQALNWRGSVIDLLVLLRQPAGFEARERLATELQVQNSPIGSAERSSALRKAIMRELIANSGRVSANIRLPNLANVQQPRSKAPESPSSVPSNNVQVAEPTFPLTQPPTCLECGDPSNRIIVTFKNRLGNAGRPYYACSHRGCGSRTFITFDDNIGIKPSNPRCRCGCISRLYNKDANTQCYCCPVGHCRFQPNALLLPPRTVQMQTGPNRFGATRSSSSAETESTQESSAPSVINVFVTAMTDLLYEDNVLNTLLSEALNDEAITEDELQRNFRLILLQYGHNLEDEAESEEEIAAAGCVRHYSSLVSRNICRRVANSLGDPRFVSLQERVERVEIVDKVDLSREELDNAPEEATMTPKSDEDNIDTLHSYYESLPELSSVEKFLVTGNAFTMIRESLQNFINPSFQNRLMKLMDRYGRVENEDEFRPNGDLHGILAELMDSDPSCIRWTDSEGTRWSDLLKWKLECWTRETWYWWPFKPPQRPLGPGEARLHWSCECEQQRWAETPADFARAVTHSAQTYLTRRQLVSHPGSTQPAQAAHFKELPSLGMASSNAAEEFAKGTLAVDGSWSPGGNLHVGASPYTNASADSPPLMPQHIFLLVAAGADFRLAQIRVERLTTYEFFRELRQQYNDLRLFFRRWLSIWVYSHCDFYRCDKYEAHHYEPRREEFPDMKVHQDYQYEPNPMNLIPPIGPHQFYVRFHACYDPRPAFHLLHKCVSFDKRNRDLLQLFPKCKFDLPEDSDKREPFWGIVARERPSVFRLLLYNFVCASPSLVFFFMWLFSWGHGADLQNASVPLSVMLVALSIFWSIFFANLEFKQGNMKVGHRP